MIIEIRNETNSGRRTGWTRRVTAVDVTKSNGYAFEGEFLNEGEVDLNPGDVLIQKNPMGSVKNAWHEGVCIVVDNNGNLHDVGDKYDWKEQFLSFRNLVAEQLGTQQNPLAGFSDEEITAEYQRRQP